MVENQCLLLTDEQLNLINLSIIENISKYIPEIIVRVMPLIMEKIDIYLKQFGQTTSTMWSYFLKALSKKQNISYIAITNYGLIYCRKNCVYKFKRCEWLLDLYGNAYKKILCIFHANSEMAKHM